MSRSDRWRLTRAGIGFCALGIGVGVAAVLTADPLLGSILWGQLATLAAAATLSRRNLAGLRAHRELPAELFAAAPALGQLWLSNSRARPAHQVVVQELDSPTRARFVATPAHSRDARPVRWQFSHRGRCELAGLTLRSSYPFGLIARERSLPQPADLIIYPQPAGEQGVRLLAGRGDWEDVAALGQGDGDLQGLRPYVPGDPVRRLHWPTTARAGRPMVVVTGSQTAREVIVEVAEAEGADWERALSAAAAGIEQHFAAQDAVGLQIEGEAFAPRSDGGWRRVLLERLALAAPREATRSLR